MLQVLVVERQSRFRHLLVNVLADAGYAVDVARDGPTALARLQDRHADIMVIDGVSGSELLAARRTGSALASLSAAITSSAVVTSATYDGIHDRSVYLPKPFTMDDLLAALARCTERAATAPRRPGIRVVGEELHEPREDSA